MIERGWWYTATTEQRLAQIDAGIELGMTAKQIAMNCGCVYEYAHRDLGVRIYQFAVYHGRKFPDRSQKPANAVTKMLRNQARPQRLAEAKAAYIAGENVDFWSVT